MRKINVMYLGDVTELVSIADEKLRTRTATVENLAPSPEIGKILNLFILVPTMITAALAIKPLSKFTKVSLMLGGIATLAANISKG